MSKMTPEQNLAELLIHYINAKPNHVTGLCSWLLRSVDLIAENECDTFDPYGAVRIARNMREAPGFKEGWRHMAYLPCNYGYTRERAQLAKFMLRQLEQGNLFWTESEGWQFNTQKGKR